MMSDKEWNALDDKYKACKDKKNIDRLSESALKMLEESRMLSELYYKERYYREKLFTHCWECGSPCDFYGNCPVCGCSKEINQF